MASRNERTYGYARVSTREQNLDRQLDALREFGVREDCIVCDKASGKDFDRPGYRRLIRKLRPGDVLVVKSIDRLGRSYQEILNQWRAIVEERKAAIVVIDMPLLDTRRGRNDVTGMLISDIVLQLLSYVAQMERESIKQRQAEGIESAHRRGVRFGRPCKKRPACYQDVCDDYAHARITRRVAAERLGVSVSTFDRWRRADRVARESRVEA